MLYIVNISAAYFAFFSNMSIEDNGNVLPKRKIKGKTNLNYMNKDIDVCMYYSRRKHILS